MGVFDFRLPCGCQGVSTTHSGGDTAITITCGPHTPSVGNSFRYSLGSFQRFHGFTGAESTTRVVQVLDAKNVVLKGMFQRTLVKLRVPDFSIEGLRNPLFFTEFDGEPSFRQDGNSAVVIDIFDAMHIDRH